MSANNLVTIGAGIPLCRCEPVFEMLAGGATALHHDGFAAWHARADVAALSRELAEYSASGEPGGASGLARADARPRYGAGLCRCDHRPFQRRAGDRAAGRNSVSPQQRAWVLAAPAVAIFKANAPTLVT